jgi:hypothetical protein
MRGPRFAPVRRRLFRRPKAAAGAPLTDAEEELHFAVIGSDALLAVVIS